MKKLITIASAATMLTIGSSWAGLKSKMSPSGMEVQDRYKLKKGILGVGSMTLYKPKAIEGGKRLYCDIDIDALIFKQRIKLESVVNDDFTEAKSYKFESVLSDDYKLFDSRYDPENYVTTATVERVKEGKKTRKDLKGDIASNTIDPLTGVFYYITKQKLEVGNDIRFKVSDAYLEQERDARFLVTGLKEIEAGGKEQMAYVVNLELEGVAFIVEEKGVKITAWISADENQRVLRLDLTTPKTGKIKFLLDD